ncbi:hypothetical protein [Actinocrispum wychmicini]|uniref:Uncharacterized protein n=1 Tax=Actinocrispum wychmicini TaxID=1213861 RepID=A0A4R2IW81_9PSEU|nr:hypothetical protein [Actinocrispum wychmicini]TCO49694.1 hypothetical protein EV192_11460 [Actinocrispum wychmicini]
MWSIHLASEPGGWESTFVHDFLPTVAVATGLLAVIWLACVIITIAGIYLAGLVVLGVRALIRTAHRWIRGGRTTEYARLVTVDADGVTATPITPRRARRLHEPSPTPHHIPPGSPGWDEP